MSSSSSSSLVSSSNRRIGEENNGNPLLTGMLLGLQELEERIIATTSCTNTQLRVPSIIDIVGCDITIEDIQLAKRELVKQKVDLKMDVNENQAISTHWDNQRGVQRITPLLHCCMTGNLLIVRLLFLIGADCTKSCNYGYWFPMLAAAEQGHLDICKWLFEYGDAKCQINKEKPGGLTPLAISCTDKETSRWLLRNGGGQHLSRSALRLLFSRINEQKEETISNILVLWMRENIQLYNTFILLLCGATNMIATTPLSEPSDGVAHKHKRERSLQILDGYPGVMELIGGYVGLIKGKEIRMLKEYNDLVIEYNMDESTEDEE